MAVFIKAENAKFLSAHGMEKQKNFKAVFEDIVSSNKDSFNESKE